MTSKQLKFAASGVSWGDIEYPVIGLRLEEEVTAEVVPTRKEALRGLALLLVRRPWAVRAVVAHHEQLQIARSLSTSASKFSRVNSSGR